MKWRIALAGTASVVVLAPAAQAAQAAAAATDQTTVTQVIVTAPRQEAKARAVQMDAPNLIAVQPAETILKYPDFNAAEALGRMPGISLSSDTGEGRFVQIRGIDANLDGATYGGVPLLNTNLGGTESGGGGRAVEFDTIPTGAIDGIIVTYTLLPDHEAEGLGGSIELTPRSAVGITKPYIEGTLGWGDEPLHDHTGPFEADIAMGIRFGFGDHGLQIVNGDLDTLHGGSGWISNPAPFSIVIFGSRQDDRRAIDDLEESYIDDFNPDGSRVSQSNAVSQYDLRRYDYHRRRFDYGSEFDFQPNDNHRFYARADVAGYTEAVRKNFLLFMNMDSDTPRNADGTVPTDPSHPNVFDVFTDPAITETDEEEVHRNSIFAVGGVDRWGDIVLDYHAAYSRATFHVRRNIGAEFDGPTAIPLTYDNVTTPNCPIFTTPGTNLNDPSIYSLNTTSIGNEQDFDTDEEFSYAANLTFPLRLINSADRVKVGAEVRLRDKAASEFDEFYDAPALSLPGLSGPALTYYDGHYTNGPQINLYAIRALIGSGVAVLDPSMSGFNPSSYIAARENIFAGYAQYTTEIGKWGFLAGVRVEDTQASYGGFSVDPNTNLPIGGLDIRRVGYTNFFPTVQLKYAFTPTMIVRATISTGIGRPGFTQNTTAASVDRTQNPVAITFGNPNLQPTTGDAFDLSLEYYLPQGGIMSLAAFDKEFSNYIVPRIQNGITVAPGQDGNTTGMTLLANVTTFLNIPHADARGIEADYHQKFTGLPKPFDGFGIEANLTLVDSHILEYTAAQSLTGQNESGLLPGTSQVTWNLAGFYEAHGIETRLAAEYVSHSLFGLGGDKSLDTIQDDRLTLDLTSSYAITPHWTIYFNAKNLLNTPLRYYEGSPDRPIQREFYDVTLEGGVRVKF